MSFDKKILSEEDIKMKYITPAIEKSGWDIKKQVRAEYTFTDGRVIVRGNLTSRGKKKRADYLLFYKPNLPIAIIEAKDNKKTIGAGMQQGIEYAEILDVPFAYSSNGDGFIEHDMKNGTEREISLDKFPSPEELWNRYKEEKNITNEQEEIITESYFFAKGDKQPRYYQRNAINRTIEAIAKGQDRILLVMATGTGKTYTTFQIIYRLWKSRRKKKILFLADRNILVDQTMQNDFKPFQNVMTKIENKTIDSSYEVYLALYQQLSGQGGEEIFKQFSPEFFDLIVIDEAHRGSARDDSSWRKILDYFENATKIGLTATPKETKNISNIAYFGEPIYTYSLKDGIEDGFLAPYKVIRIGLDKDLEGYRPTKGKRDIYGELIEDREYNVKDFDRVLVIDDRTKKVAQKVTEYLKKTDRFSKTIVFCVDIEHAERMRQALINENTDLVAQNSKYIMRITGDNAEGKAQLDNFIDEDSLYPTIVTTSKLMTTGVDCKTCKLIVLDTNIGSMIEFKQIIGRGTRLKPDYGKEYFTVMDFRNVSRLFADPDWDGEPVQIYEPNEQNGDDIVPPDVEEDDNGKDEEEINPGNKGTDIDVEIDGSDNKTKRHKYVIRDVVVTVISERVQYYDKDGKLITESLKDYTKKNILEEFADLDTFLKRWNSGEKREAIIEELKEQGILLDALREDIGNPDIDDFDLICHIAYDKPPLKKAERVNNVKKRGYLYKYSDMAQKVLEGLLEKYKDEGLKDLEKTEILELNPFNKIGSPLKLVKAFGNKKRYLEAVKELEQEIYA